MMGMQAMDAPPDIRRDALSGEIEDELGNEDEEGHSQDEYDFDLIRLVVVEGKHPDDEPLSTDMSRWNISNEDLAELAAYLKTLQ